jgi:hypothetical protein
MLHPSYSHFITTTNRFLKPLVAFTSLNSNVSTSPYSTLALILYILPLAGKRKFQTKQQVIFFAIRVTFYMGQYETEPTPTGS